MNIELTNNEKTKVDEFARVHLKLKALEIEYKELKQYVDSLASKSNTNEEVVLKTDNSTVVYSKAAENLKFTSNINNFLTETNNFDVLDISITKARKLLSKDELSKFFNVEMGSRRLSTVIGG